MLQRVLIVGSPGESSEPLHPPRLYNAHITWRAGGHRERHGAPRVKQAKMKFHAFAYVRNVSCGNQQSYALLLNEESSVCDNAGLSVTPQLEAGGGE